MGDCKERLDLLLVKLGLAETRSKAQRLIMAGEVLVGGRVYDKPGRQVPCDAEVTVRQRPRYVSRGGEKLEKALEEFGIDVSGLVAADIGASTGGFTDCLLRHGARRVYAIDVGYGQLDWKLRRDPRVVVMERTNIRYLEGLPEPVDIVTIDVSFIGLELVLPKAVELLGGEGEIIPLVKPQFQAGRGKVGKGGVVRDPEVHREVLEAVIKLAVDLGLTPVDAVASPIKGPAGNIEFLLRLTLGKGYEPVQAESLVMKAISSAPK